MTRDTWPALAGLTAALTGSVAPSDRTLTILEGDNLETLQRLADEGQRFDLVELDGPYMAGLEDWDTLTEDQYLDHYAARLTLVRQILQPWGVVFLFGYPEGCAEVKAWARQTGTLHLRRWLTWYKQRTAHKGRKVESVLVFMQPDASSLWLEFRNWLRQKRRSMGLTILEARPLVGMQVYDVGAGGGYMWFEADCSSIPGRAEYVELKRVFGVPDYFDILCDLRAFEDLTNIDYLSATYPEDTRELNDVGLRSKPVGLYLDLFRPVVPPREDKRALVLYGGSGNAGVAAGQLGYDVTICEQDAARCGLIRRRWAWHVERKDMTPADEMGPLFAEVTT